MAGGGVLHTDPIPDKPCGMVFGCEKFPGSNQYGHQIQNLMIVDSPVKNNLLDQLYLRDPCNRPGAECRMPINLQNLMIVDSSKQPRHSRNPQPHPVPKSDNY